MKPTIMPMKPLEFGNLDDILRKQKVERRTLEILLVGRLWDLSGDKNFATSKYFHNALGKFLYLNLGFAINVMMKNAYFDSSFALKENLKPYSDIFDNKAKRIATFEYAKELLNSSDFTNSLLAKLNRKSRFFPIYGCKLI